MIPSLSVVVPVYNGERFVEQAIDSILTQSALPPQLQICLINDASTDGSQALCQRLAQHHPVVDYIELPTNQGVAQARNAGVRRARHEFLAFLDQDDLWTHDKLADGWRFGPVKDADAKTHPCLLPYDDLPAWQRAKDALFLGIVRAMSVTP